MSYENAESESKRYSFTSWYDGTSIGTILRRFGRTKEYSRLSGGELGGLESKYSRITLSRRQYCLGIVTVAFGIFAVHTILGIALFRFHGRPVPEYALPGPDNALRNCSNPGDIGTSRVLGGIPGFYTIENLWYHQGSYHLYADDFPPESMIMSGRAKMIVHQPNDLRPRPTVCFDGTTILNNDGSKPGWTGLTHYYHLIGEDLLGALAAWAAIEAPIPEPKRLVMPWSESWIDRWGIDRVIPFVKQKSWRDRYGINEIMVEGMFSDPVVERDQWERLTGDDGWVYFKRAIFIDRWASHAFNPSANIWNKMSLPIFETPHRPNFFQATRNRLLEHYHITLPSEGKCPKIVYIDRQSSHRRLPDDTHLELLAVFKGLEAAGFGTFVDVVMEKLSVIEQIEVVADANVMIGIHGNGLTHQMWMPLNSTVIELFPPDTFLRDFQILADVLGHEYIVVVNDAVLARQEWEAEPGERAGAAHDGTRVQISPGLVKMVLEDVLRNKAVACRPRVRGS